jgi:hypothetical protein
MKGIHMFQAAFPLRRTTRISFGLALAVSALSSAHAVDTPLASGTASLSHIRYELANTDGTSASSAALSFGMSADAPMSGWVGAFGQTGANDVASVQNWTGVLPASVISVNSSDGYTSAQAGPDSLSTSFSVDKSVLDKTAVGPDGSGLSRFEVFSQTSTGLGVPSLGYSVDDATGKVSATPDGLSWPYYDFTLAAHTTLTVHATGSASLTVQPEQGGWDFRNPGGDASTLPNIGSGVQVALMLQNPGFQMKPAYDSLEAFYADMDQAYTLSMDTVAANWVADDASAMLPQLRDLTVSVTNNSDQAAHGSFVLTGMSQFAVVKPDSAVPEPGTWLLMALGLIGLLAANRRQR